MSCVASKLTSGAVQLNSSTATLIVAARSSRKVLKLAFGSGVAIGDSGLDLSNKFDLNSGNSGETEIETSDAVYGISVSGTPTIKFIELHD